MKLKVTCKSNEDLNGTWIQRDVEAELRDIGIKINGDLDWIDFILAHLFGDPPREAIYAAILDHDVQSIVFKVGSDVVKIEKIP